MNDHEIPMLTWIELREAFRQPGCPICHLKRRVADRYIFRLLWENVNDVTTRVHLLRSLGFCPEHTWQLYHTEISQFGSGLGVSIIYENLVHRVMGGLRHFEAHLRAPQQPRTHWWQRAWTRLKAAFGWAGPARRPTSISPSEPCRVCVHCTDAEERYIHWLVMGCADPDFRESYGASDGLCLPHLRQALERATPDHPDEARFLIGVTEARLERLSVALSEYARKQTWQYRHEEMTDDERDAPRRASLFFGGPDGTAFT
jgi:hypothetical protein